MKRMFILIMALLAPISLTACGGMDRVELKDRLIIECIGIDIDADGYLLSVQVLNTGSGGSSGNSQPEEITKSYESKGATVSEAMNGLVKSLGKQTMNSHNRVIILGRSLAERGITDALDFFLRDYTSRATVKLAVAEKTAGEIVRANYGKTVVGAKVLESVMDEGLLYSSVPGINVLQAVNRISDETAACCMPVVGLEKTGGEGEDEEFIPKIRSAAIFVKDAMAAELDGDETQGFFWVAGMVNKGTIAVVTPSGSRMSLAVVRADTDIKLSRENGAPSFRIEISCACDITEYQNSVFSDIGADEAAQAAKAAESEIIRLARAAINKAVTQNGSDIFRFGRVLWLKSPALYRELSGNWRDNVKNLDTQIYAKVTVRLAQA